MGVGGDVLEMLVSDEAGIIKIQGCIFAQSTLV